MADQVVIKIGANASGAIAAFGLVSGAAQAMANRVIGFGLNMARSLARAIPESLKNADSMFKQAQSAGMNVETFSALAHAANLAGVSLEAIATASRESARDGKDFYKNLLDTAKLFETMPDGVEKTKMALDRFGARSGTALIPLLNAGSNAIREQMEEARRLGIVISGPLGQAAEKYNDTLTRIKTAVDGMVLRVADRLLPQMQRISGEVFKLATDPRTTQFFVDLGSNLAVAAKAAADIINSGIFQKIASLSADRKATPASFGYAMGQYVKSGIRPDMALYAALDDANSGKLNGSHSYAKSYRHFGGEEAAMQMRAQPQPIVADKITIQVPESKASSAFTSRGFLSQGEAQMVSRTASFQKNVQSTLAEILGLQRQYLPKMAESLS